MKIKLKQPVQNLKGEEVTELHFDLENLTGADVIAAEREYRLIEKDGGVMLPDMYSKNYQSILASKAAKVSHDVITSLPLNQFTNITMHVQNFLMGD